MTLPIWSLNLKNYQIYLQHVILLHCKETIAENLKPIFPEKELRGLSPNFHIQVSASDLYISTIDLPILLQDNMWTDPGNM